VPVSWDIQPGVYAIVGAAATLAAVFRSSLSLVVILVEGTRGINFLPGILVAVIISNFIAHWVHPDGVYESELEADGRVFFLRQEPPGKLRILTAENIMESPVIGLHEIESVARVLQVLSSTAHNGFPVHPCQGGSYNMDPAENSKLSGFILRSQLLILLGEKAFCDVNGNYLSRVASSTEAYETSLDRLMHHATHGGEQIVDELLHVEASECEDEKDEEIGVPKVIQRAVSIMDEIYEDGYLLDLLAARADIDGIGEGMNLSTASKSVLTDIYINLKPFMDRGMITVRPESPAAHVHQIFVSMSLRHLCVTDSSSRLVGIVTRKDLDRAAGPGWWRRSRMAPEPQAPPDILRSTSWFASSLQSLAIPPRRILSDFIQKFSPSPAASGMQSHRRWALSSESSQEEEEHQQGFPTQNHHPSLKHFLAGDEENSSSE